MNITLQQIIACHPENERYFGMLADHFGKRNALIPFIGAGLSKPIYPLWNEVLTDMAKAAGARHLHKVNEYLSGGKHEEAAEYLRDKVRGSGRFLDDLRFAFGTDKLDPSRFSEACRCLPRLFRGPVITTNYDRMLDAVYDDAGLSFEGQCLPRLPYDGAIIDRVVKMSGHYLIKLHGDIDNPQTCVLTAKEYDEIYGKLGTASDTIFVEMLKKLYRQGNFLFLGCGLDTDRTLDILGLVIGSGEFDNYAILELPKETGNSEPNVANLYDAAGDRWEALEHKERALSDLRVRCLWYPYGQHEAVAVILRELLSALESKTPTPPVPFPEKSAPPFQHTHGLLGREELVNDIRAQLLSAGENLLIAYGAPGMGKTEVCHEVVNRAASEGWAPLPIPLQGEMGYEMLLSAIARKLGHDENHVTAETLLAALEARCRVAKLLMYLDNFEDSLYRPEKSESGWSREERSIEFIVECSKVPNMKVLVSCREEITSLRGKSVKPLDAGSAVTLFQNVWKAGDGDGDILQREDSELRNFVITDLGAHPLSIVLMASQCHVTGNIRDLRRRWQREAGKISIDYAENRLHKSLRAAISTSFAVIRKDPFCLRIWGVLSLLPGGISVPIFEALFSDILGEAQASMRRMIKLNLVEYAVGGYTMPKSIKGRVFEYLPDSEPGGERDSITTLCAYYLPLLQQAQPGQAGWDKTRRVVISQIDDLLFFLLYLHNHQCWDELKLLHQKTLFLYQFRVSFSVEFLEKMLLEKELAKISDLLGNTYEVLGDLKSRLGASEEALGLYSQAETLYRQEQRSLSLANVLASKGELKSRLGAIDEALSLYTQAETLYREENDNLGLANVLLNIGNMRSLLGAVEEALGLYGQAETLYKQERDDLGLANVLRCKGTLKTRLGAIEEALELYSQSETLYKQEQENLGLANVLASKGTMKYRLGAIEEALELYDQAESMFKQERDNLGLANVLRSKGNLKRNLGALKEALRLYNQSETLYRQEQENLGLANVLKSKGDLKRRLGAIEEVPGLYDQAETLYRQERDNLGLANVLQSKGILRSHLGATEEALDLYGQAETLYKQEQNNLGLANVLQSKGNLKSQLGAIGEALELYGQAETLYRQVQSNLGLANVMKGKGDLKSRLGAREEALGLYGQAETQYRQAQDNLGLANVLQSEGDLCCATGDYPTAQDCYEEALDLYRIVCDNVNEAYVLGELSKVYAVLKLPEMAEKTMKSLSSLPAPLPSVVATYVMGCVEEARRILQKKRERGKKRTKSTFLKGSSTLSQ